MALQSFLTRYMIIGTDHSKNTYFIYDDSTGVILEIPSKCIEELKQVKRLERDEVCINLNKILDTMSRIRSKMQNIPIIKASFISKKDYFEMLGRIGLTELILETTTACNMRCKYCVYSGSYEGFRTHGFSHMKEDVAFRAVNLYFKLFEQYAYLNPLRIPTIGFYGGEPLLNFKLIKQTVNYIKEKYGKKYNVRYMLTTNGTIMTKEIAEFLINNDFNVFVSIDGPREEHDRNRILLNGKGSFDLIMSNVEKYIRVAKKLGIQPKLYAIATYDIRSNLIKMWKFFNDVYDKIKLVYINPVRPFDTTYYSQFTEEDYMKFKEQENYLREIFIEYVKSGKWRHERDVFLDVYFGHRVILTILDIKIIRAPNSILPFGRSCLPLYRMYVDVSGRIMPCEKAPSTLVIGDVYNGIDFKRLKKLLEEYQKFQFSVCRKCKFRNSCRSCIAIIMPIKYNNVNKKCEILRKTIVEDLKLAVEVIKANPEYVTYIVRNPLFKLSSLL